MRGHAELQLCITQLRGPEVQASDSLLRELQECRAQLAEIRAREQKGEIEMYNLRQLAAREIQRSTLLMQERDAARAEVQQLLASKALLRSEIDRAQCHLLGMRTTSNSIREDMAQLLSFFQKELAACSFHIQTFSRIGEKWFQKYKQLQCEVAEGRRHRRRREPTERAHPEGSRMSSRAAGTAGPSGSAEKEVSERGGRNSDPNEEIHSGDSAQGTKRKEHPP